VAVTTQRLRDGPPPVRAVTGLTCAARNGAPAGGPAQTVGSFVFFNADGPVASCTSVVPTAYPVAVSGRTCTVL